MSAENQGKIVCPKCKQMMIPQVTKYGCGGGATQRTCPLCGKRLGTKGMACCFIATAAYGSPLNDNVKILCFLRDRYLLKWKSGRKLVALYYKQSPSIAEIIANSNILKALVRFFLYPIVFFTNSLFKMESKILWKKF